MTRTKARDFGCENSLENQRLCWRPIHASRDARNRFETVTEVGVFADLVGQNLGGFEQALFRGFTC